MKSDPKNDTQAFFPDTDVFICSSGEQIKIPRITWGKEIKLLKSASAIIKSVPELNSLSINPETGVQLTDILKLVPSILETVPEQVTGFVALMLDRTSEWVNENLSSSDVVGLVFPFFKKFMANLVGTLPKMQTPAALPAA